MAASGAGAGTGRGTMTPEEEARRRGSLKAKTSSFAMESIHRVYTFPLASLGSGMYGTVVKGEHKKEGFPVAIKQIKRKIRDRKQLKGVISEIEIMRAAVTATGNTNLCRLHNAYQDHNRLYIVLEFCGGGELFDRIVKLTHYSEDSASQLMQKLTKAVQDLHKAGIIHRDLKPENILLKSGEDDTDIRITDFGLSCVEGEEDLHRAQAVGSPGYISPQVLASPPVYSPACDVWALGVILYILLVGFPPFYGESREMRRNIKNGRFEFLKPWWDTVSDDAKDLVSKCLVVDPDKRITTEQILEHKWIKEHQSDEELHLAENLAKFNARRKFRAAIMSAMWATRMGAPSRIEGIVSKDMFKEEEIHTLREKFFHVAKDGKVDLKQFEQVLTDVGLLKVPAKEMFVAFDEDESGFVDYKEFLAGLTVLKSRDKDALKLVFDIFDQDSSGSISPDEMGKVLRSVLNKEEAGLLESADMFASLFADFDHDGDGEITFEEFKAHLEKDESMYKLLLDQMDASKAIETPKSNRRSRHSMLPVREGHAAGAGSAADASEDAGAATGAPATAPAAAEASETTPAAGPGTVKPNERRASVTDRCTVM